MSHCHSVLAIPILQKTNLLNFADTCVAGDKELESCTFHNSLNRLDRTQSMNRPFFGLIADFQKWSPPVDDLD